MCMQQFLYYLPFKNMLFCVIAENFVCKIPRHFPQPLHFQFTAPISDFHLLLINHLISVAFCLPFVYINSCVTLNKSVLNWPLPKLKLNCTKVGVFVIVRHIHPWIITERLRTYHCRKHEYTPLRKSVPCLKRLESGRRVEN